MNGGLHIRKGSCTKEFLKQGSPLSFSRRPHGSLPTNAHFHLYFTSSGGPGTPATTPITTHRLACRQRPLTPKTWPSFSAAQRFVLAHASTPTPKDRHLVTSPPPATAVVGDIGVHHRRRRREPKDARPSLSLSLKLDSRCSRDTQGRCDLWWFYKCGGKVVITGRIGVCVYLAAFGKWRRSPLSFSRRPHGSLPTNAHFHLYFTSSGGPGTPATTPITTHRLACRQRPLTPKTWPSFSAAQRFVLAHASTPTPKDRHLVTSPPPATAVVGDIGVHHRRRRREPKDARPSLSLSLKLDSRCSRDTQGRCDLCAFSSFPFYSFVHLCAMIGLRREGGDNGKDWCLCVFGCLWEMETVGINGGGGEENRMVKAEERRGE
ncbi:hypothetical protein DEO72_LG6g831 [Vigna unguiculata]|uniref:Uncharacterized protein n=1 Tax=Vigna unguiculata TaxID=3917 RepID=A0A4D6M484_VIGUN|nr:hypothetical protein DEO72_LG6g831 [Vigna unguiculata]